MHLIFFDPRRANFYGFSFWWVDFQHPIFAKESIKQHHWDCQLPWQDNLKAKLCEVEEFEFTPGSVNCTNSSLICRVSKPIIRGSWVRVWAEKSFFFSFFVCWLVLNFFKLPRKIPIFTAFKHSRFSWS